MYLPVCTCKVCTCNIIIREVTSDFVCMNESVINLSLSIPDYYIIKGIKSNGLKSLYRASLG